MYVCTAHDERVRRACSAESTIRIRGLLAWMSDLDLARYVGMFVWEHDLEVHEILALAERRQAVHDEP